MNWAIRRERPGDEDAIFNVTFRAFDESEIGYHGEAELIAKLRAGCSDFASFVAEFDDQLIGHILFTPVTIDNPNRPWHGMGLAPMSVLPAYQRRGVGVSLVNAGLTALRESKVPFVVVLGHPTYYPRFGFVSASKHGITTTFGREADDLFMIHPMARRETDLIPGRARFRPEFDTVA